MKFCLSLLFLFISFYSICQTGPGGVETNDGTSNLVLWLSGSNLGINGYLSGDGVSTWSDLSGYGSDVISADLPEFISSSLNGLPIIQFTSANEEHLDGILSAETDAPLTLIAVGLFSANPQADNTNPYLIGLGGGSASQASISRQDLNDANPNAYYSFTGSARSVGPTLNPNQWYSFMAQYNTTAPFHTLYLGNTIQTVNNDFPAALNAANGNVSLGQNLSGLASTFLDGNIAEVIIINRLLNDAERNIIFNYLSAKYDLPINNDLYVGDNTAAGDYDLQVAGVGTEASGSQSSASSAGLNITSNAGFGNGDYVLFGHRVNTNSVNTLDVEEVGDILEARWSRVWSVDVTDAGTALSANLEFSFGDAGVEGMPAIESNYHLVRSLGEALGWEVVSSSGNISGATITFSNIVLEDGNYTLASSDLSSSPLSSNTIGVGAGPAGLGSTDGSDALLLWLDASQITGHNDGDNIQTWADLSGNGYNATQATVGLRPNYIEDAQNGNPTIRFNGAGDFMAGNFGDLDAPFTLFAVGQFDQANQDADNNDYIFDIGAGAPLLDQPGIHASVSRRMSNDPIARTNRYYSFQGNGLLYGPEITGGVFHAFASVYQSAFPFHQMFYDGALAETAPGTLALNTNGAYQLGSLIDQPINDFFLEGDIAEIIIYDTPLNSAQVRIVQAYLGAKWAIPLINDLYEGDNPSNGNNDLEVSGVGRAMDGDWPMAHSAGLAITMGNHAELESFAVFGHAIENNSMNTSDINGAILGRVDRAWYFSVTGALGNSLDFVFDFSEMGLSGLLDSDADYSLIFRESTMGNWTIVATPGVIDGDRVVFGNVDVASSGNGFYTLAYIDDSVLPIQLISFSAKANEEGFNPVVDLKWATASEINNSHFTIERSSDGKVWDELNQVLGNKNASTNSSYLFKDQSPLLGVSYYRLKQTDLDHTYSYPGAPQRVVVGLPNYQWMVFPNPSSGVISITTSHSLGEYAILVLASLSGVKVQSIELKDVQQQTISTNLNEGVYVVTIQNSPYHIPPQKLIIQK